MRDAGALLMLAAIGVGCGGGRRAELPVRVSLGEGFSSAIRSDGTVWWWGTMGHVVERQPVQVPGIAHATDLAAARFYACAVVASGAVWCWGEEGFGRISGRPDVFGTQAPRQVEGVTEAVRVATGEYHACALQRDGSVWCWGRNRDGELGFRGVESEKSEMHPAKVVLSGATDLAAFGTRTCAVRNGEVLCWGRGATRIAEDGSSGSIPRAPSSDAEIAPARVPGIDHVQRIWVAHHHACALRDDASLWCWGENECGQAMPGTEGEVTAPAKAAEHVRTAAVGWSETCAAAADGSLQCWGCGDGTLGDGGGNRETPGPVPGVSADDVALSGAHACAIARDGRAWCWGNNYGGRLGIGRDADDVVPLATPVRW